MTEDANGAFSTPRVKEDKATDAQRVTLQRQPRQPGVLLRLLDAQGVPEPQPHL